jgi:hypothetical protein
MIMLALLRLPATCAYRRGWSIATLRETTIFTWDWNSDAASVIGHAGFRGSSFPVRAFVTVPGS